MCLAPPLAAAPTRCPLPPPLPAAQAVRTHLPRIQEGGSLASVLDHAMYCGGSLGRVGLDFRPLLAPLFEQAVLAMFSKVGSREEGRLCRVRVPVWLAPTSCSIFSCRVLHA